MVSNIRQLRIEKHVTQMELGEAIGLSQQIISRMERDRSKIQVDTLIALADYFEVSTDCVLGYHAKNQPASLDHRYLSSADDTSEKEDQEMKRIVDSGSRKEVLGLLLDLVYNVAKQQV